MGIKYLYKGFYYPTIMETYMDYGACSESISGAGGFPSSDSIELFLDYLIEEDIEIKIQSIRIPRIGLENLGKKYSNKYSNKTTIGLHIEYEIYDGFIITHFETQAEIFMTN